MGVINDILDFSKIESGKMELEHHDFNLRDCIEDVLDVFATKAAQTGLDLIYEIDHGVPSQIIGDNLRLRQVLLNLVSNAIKFTHKGEIFVGVCVSKVHENNLELRFEVRDTGIGIQADKLERLFKAFSQVDSSTTRKYGGTGLGLAISDKLITLMGGYIQVESEPHVGTRFIFTIQAQAGQQSTRTYVHMNVAGIQGKRVLVVDDNETNLSIIKNQLEQWKITPVLARSGNEAVRILANDSFDLALTDMQMPEMDGITLAQHVRLHYPNLPILLLSSVGDEKARHHVNLFNAILTKPVKQQVLYKHVVHHLRQQGLPMPEEQPSAKKLTEEFARQFPFRILIAEDNPVNQKLAQRVLMKLGYLPDIAENGIKALEMLESTDYDLIFMDVQMPEMDGYEATRQIRKQNRQNPIIIAMTANAMQGDKETCLNAGMDDYVSKPIKLEDLIEVIESWGRKKRRSA
jgi:CheY-like chemotaxis protein